MDYGRRHLRFGWWSLLLFATLGFALEGLHAFKVPVYLNASSESRRLLWTLAHAHGTLLSLINIIYGVSLRALPDLRGRHQPMVSLCLIGAAILLPAGFFLGGIEFYAGDPGLGAILIPIGAALLLAAIALIARTAGALGLSENAGRPASKNRN